MVNSEATAAHTPLNSQTRFVFKVNEKYLILKADKL